MLDELFQESGILQAHAEEIAAKAAAEAATKAAAEGRAEGEMTRVALEGRFGMLPQDVLAALATANEASLRAIIGRIATVSLDEVRAQLTASEAQ